MYAESRAKNAAAASNSSLSLSLHIHTSWRSFAKNTSCNQIKSSYLGGADTAVLILLKSRGSGLGSLNELKLALTARHTRGLGHLDDVFRCQNQLAVEKRPREKGWCVGDRSAKQRRAGNLDFWPDPPLVSPSKSGGAKKEGRKKGTSTRIGTTSNWDLLSQLPFLSYRSSSFPREGERKKKPVV